MSDQPNESAEAERFDIYCACGHRVIHSAEPEGEWIRLEDYEALRKERDELKANLRKMTEDRDSWRALYHDE